jgi:hypothetical protein
MIGRLRAPAGGYLADVMGDAQVSVNVTPNGLGDALLKTQGWRVVRVDQHGEVTHSFDDVSVNGLHLGDGDGEACVNKSKGVEGKEGNEGVLVLVTESEAKEGVDAAKERLARLAKEEIAPPEVFIIPEVRCMCFREFEAGLSVQVECSWPIA